MKFWKQDFKPASCNRSKESSVTKIQPTITLYLNDTFNLAKEEKKLHQTSTFQKFLLPD
jgi:hypothetical protein